MKVRLLLALPCIAGVALGAICLLKSGLHHTSPLVAGKPTIEAAPATVPDAIPVGGRVISEIDLSIVRGIDFTLPGRRLVARRRSGTTPNYSIEVTTDKGEKVEACRSGLAFAEVLADVAAIRVTHSIDPIAGAKLFSAHAPDVGELLFITAPEIEIEESPYRVLVLDGPVPRAVVADEQLYYESALSPRLIRMLAAGCSALGAAK